MKKYKSDSVELQNITDQTLNKAKQTPLNDSDEVNQSQTQKQDAQNYFGQVSNNDLKGDFAQNSQHYQTPNGNSIHLVTGINSVSGDPIKRQRNIKDEMLQAENQSSNGDNNAHVNGKEDFSQGGTNFGSHFVSQNDNTTTKQHLELQQGQAMRSLRSLVGMSNQITTHKYKRSIYGLILLICDTIFTFDILILVFHIVVTALSNRQDEVWNIIYCVATVSIIAQVSINIFCDQKLKQADDSVNKLTCEKFVFNRKHKRFVQRPWEDLNVGDIIRINKNQEVPADCLILDIKDKEQTADYVCYIKGSQNIVAGETEIKKSCQNTQNKTGSRLRDSAFVQLLSGQIKWEYNSRGNKYQGSLKLNENPAAFEFKNEYVITRGSTLFCTEQIICMVLNIGGECLGSVIRDRNLRVPSFFTRIFKFKEVKYQKYYYGEIVHNIRILQLIAIGLSFISWFMIILVHIIVGISPLSKFETKIMQSLLAQQIKQSLPQVVQSIAGLQCQYLLFFPYLIRIVIDCIVIFHNLFVIWDINLVPSNVTVTNYFALDRLSKISNLMISPRAVLDPNLNVLTFITGSHKEYQNTNAKLQRGLKESQQKSEQTRNNQNANSAVGPDGTHLLPQQDAMSDDSSLSSDEEFRNEMDYLPISHNTAFRFENQQVTDIISQSSKSLEKIKILELARACCLCHHSIGYEKSSKEETNQRSPSRLNANYKSIYKYDEAQISFANSLKCGFTSKRGQLINISIQGKQELYEEMAIISVDLRGVPMTVQVLRPYAILEGCTIIFKAPLQAIKIFMKEHLFQKLDFDLQSFTKQGMTAITFAKKELDSEYSADLYKLISEVQTVYKGNKLKLQEVMLSQCENLDLIGTIGVKRFLNRRNSMFLEEALKNGIKVWILSSTLEYETVTLTNAMEFLQSCTQPLNVKGLTERQVEESLKACLKAASDRMQSQHEKEKGNLKEKQNKKSVLTNKNEQGKKSNESKNLKTQEKIKKLQQEVVFTNGYSLSIIMKDESLLKIFLILCSLCNCVIGSNITPLQKADLVKALKEFNVQANIGYVLSIIASPTDLFMLNEADVKIGLKTTFNCSDNLALADMNVSELHSLTYILFKHASQLNRRQRVVVSFFYQRTILLMTIITYYISIAGLSPILPYQQFFTMIFTHIITPLQYFWFGISFKDYGFDHFHRIFGEYRNNQIFNLFNSIEILNLTAKALFDAFLLCFFSFFEIVLPNLAGTAILTTTGTVAGLEAYQCYNSIVLSLIQLKRMRDNNCNIQFFQPFYYLCFFLSVIFVLEDDNLIGIKSLFSSPHMILQLVMIFLIILLQETVYKVFRQLIPSSTKESLTFYRYIEEMIFMEQYEENTQEYQLNNNTSKAQDLMKQIKSRELVAINQNMHRLHRSDSMDQILERINITGEQSQGTTDNKIVNRSTLVNKHTLKLNDYNKELEYQNQKVGIKQLEPIYYTLYCLMAICACNIAVQVADQTSGSKTVAISVILAIIILVTLGLLVLLRRFKDINQGRVLLIYILFINVAANVEKSFSMDTFRSEHVFYSVIASSFLLRHNSFFTVTLLCIISLISFSQLEFNDLIFQNRDAKHTFWQKVEAYFLLINTIIFLLILILYAYWDETTRKIGFVINFRKQKEFQKSKQILNILVPSIVRSKIQEGQKNFSDAQGMVTIVFCDIEGFDELVQLYEGKELIELLDQTYNAFDQLCDQYGLQKVETVGKTYMACGGLKIVESKIDSKLLGNNFTVRVTDMAVEMLQVASSIKLKTGQKLKLKIGIHTGDVVAGVVGETKPQFSLIGDTVNKTSRVCSKCPSKHVLVSKETHKQLEMYSNNFNFETMEVFMKGIGTEKAYKVFKRGARTIEKAKVGMGIIRQQSVLTLDQANRSHSLSTTPSRFQTSSNTKSKSQQETTNDEQTAQYQEILKSARTENTLGDHNSDQHSQFDDGDEMRKQFGNFKEDRLIVNNPALNIRYKLVERPRFLLQFNQKDQEQEFQQFLSKYYMHETIWFLIFKTFIDTALLFAVGWRTNQPILYLQLSWVLPYLILSSILVRVITVSILNQPSIVAYSIMLVVIQFLFTFVINTSQSIFDSNKDGVFVTCKQQLDSYVVIVFTLRAYQTRSTSIAQALFVISYGVHVFTNQKEGATFQGFADFIAFISFATLLSTNSYFREMSQRKQYNNERIIDIEIEKTEDLLSKLVPFHVLAGIKNDQRVVDVLENVTLLYTDMVGFTQFSNNVKNPIEVVQLLSKLFSKFDQLTEVHGVYKVHTIGDCYVIMGYTGKTPKFRRTTAVQIEEAYRVVRVGLEMIDIIREVRESSTDPNLRSLDMRIGVHTGKIVGGIIGTKVVRYDIFGQDVLIANKMESNGKGGSVCISESTLALLKQNQFIVDTLDFTEHEAIEIGIIGKKIQSYLVEQIFMSNSMGSSDQFSSEEFSSNDEKEVDKSKSEKLDLGFRETQANLFATMPQTSDIDGGDKFVDPYN